MGPVGLGHVLQALNVLGAARTGAACNTAGTPAQQRNGLIPRELLIQTGATIVANYPYYAMVSPDGRWLSYTAPPPGGGLPTIWLKSVADVLAGGGRPPVDVGLKPEIFFGPNYGWTHVANVLYYTDGSSLYTIDVSEPDRPVRREAFKSDKPWPPLVVKVSPTRPNAMLLGVGDIPPPPAAYVELYSPSLYEVDVSPAGAGGKKVFDNPGNVRAIHVDNEYKLRVAMLADQMAYFRNDGTTSSPQWTQIVPIPKSAMYTQAMLANLPLKLATLDPDNGDRALWMNNMDYQLPVYTWKDLSQPFAQSGTKVYEAKRAEIKQLWLDNFGRPIGVREFYGRQPMTVLDQKYAADWQNVQKIDPTAAFDVQSQSDDMTKWVLYSEPADRAPRCYLYDAAAKRSVELFSIMSELDDYQLPTVEPVDVPSRDGFVQTCFLTRPKDAQKGDKRPLVLHLHGWPDGWVWGYHMDWLLMADRGYYVLACNYRASSNYGRDYLMAGAGHGAKYNGTVYRDGVDAADWAVRTGLTDEGTMCLLGASFGGIEGMYAVTNYPDKFKCFIELYGTPNITMDFYGSPLMSNLSGDLLQWYLTQYGFDWRTDEGRKFLLANNAIDRADRIKSALYIAHGELDANAPFASDVQLVELLKRQGNDGNLTFVAFPKEGHAGFSRPTELVFHGYLEAFLARHLGGRYEPVRYIEGADYEMRYDTNGLSKM